MNEDRKTAAIKLKLEKALSFLNEVPMLIQYKYHGTAINRMYYSCFSATKALLITKDAFPKTHNGVLKLLYDLFVKTEKLDKPAADFYSRLLQQRIEYDYEDELVLEREDIEELYESTKKYIGQIEALINK